MSELSTSPKPLNPTFLRLSAGFIYFYFGLLKFYPDLSPGELLAGQTIMQLTGNWIDAHTALWLLAVMECAIGISFLFSFMMKWMFFVFMAHQASTFLPLFYFPEICFKVAPFAPTLEGQYIFKNLISVAAGWTVMFPMVKAAWLQPKQRTTQTTKPTGIERFAPTPTVSASAGSASAGVSHSETSRPVPAGSETNSVSQAGEGSTRSGPSVHSQSVHSQSVHTQSQPVESGVKHSEPKAKQTEAGDYCGPEVKKVGT